MKKIFIILSFITCISILPEKTEAKSVSWNKLVNETLLYYWNFGGRNVEGLSSGWQQGLEDANITVTYQAQVYNVSAGNILVSDGAVLPVGTQLRFSPKSFSDSDISWFGTGYSADSPNGHWVSGANARALCPVMLKILQALPIIAIAILKLVRM